MEKKDYCSIWYEMKIFGESNDIESDIDRLGEELAVLRERYEYSGIKCSKSALIKARVIHNKIKVELCKF